MGLKNRQISIFDINNTEFTDNYISPYDYIGDNSLDDIFYFYNNLNEEKSHFTCRDDICTPMECVKQMLDYIPTEFWARTNIKILDPCCGNGNFGVYCAKKNKP